MMAKQDYSHPILYTVGLIPTWPSISLDGGRW